MTKNCPQELIDQCRSLLEDEFFKAFTDESRQKIILLLLEHGEMTVNQVVARMEINQSNVSRHLALLKRSGVAISERRGQAIYYKPDYENISHRLQSMASIISQCNPEKEQKEKLTSLKDQEETLQQDTESGRERLLRILRGAGT